ncbi:MAG: DUF4129 domain-containing protein, partial [Ktedonobacteraceae bacterium]
GQFQSSGSITVPSGGNVPNTANKNRVLPDPGASDSGSSSPSTTQTSVQISQRLGIGFGGVILLILFGMMFFSIWWRRLFRNYSIAAQIYGRMCLMADWAGIPMRRSQTPHEYIDALVVAAPEETATLDRFGDIYVRQLWADPASPEHPGTSGEIKELPSLWKRLQPRLFQYLLRHPHFLWVVPKLAGKFLRQLQARRRAQRDLHQDL